MSKCPTCEAKSSLPNFPIKCYYCDNSTQELTSVCEACSDSKKICAICHKALAYFGN